MWGEHEGGEGGGGREKGRNKVKKNAPIICLSPGDRRKIVNSWIQKIWTDMLDVRKLGKFAGTNFVLTTFAMASIFV